MVGVDPPQLALQHWEIRQSQHHVAKPAYGADRPEPGATYRYVVDVPGIVASSDPDPGPALNFIARKFPALRKNPFV